ncbi:MAG: TIGR04255 family protein [Methylococcaceae bacterium]|nr:TIGR04255 family protein [Methylococcaceae bacterium]
MTTLQNAPLIEAIFELQWGEFAPGQFSYTQEEQSLFAGKISAAAASKGYAVTQNIQQNQGLMMMPLLVSHRFRKQQHDFPCFQVGLGVFTVNQVKEGYEWNSFKAAIEMGLEIYKQADADKLNNVKDTLSLSLRYQDAFFPEKMSTAEYLDQHFHVSSKLPDSFFSYTGANRDKTDVNITMNIETLTPKGTIVIRIANAIIYDKPGLLMETIVQSKANDCLNGDVSNEIMAWLEQAHDIQKNSFETLVKSSAYK